MPKTAGNTWRRTRLAVAIHASLPFLAVGAMAIEAPAHAQQADATDQTDTNDDVKAKKEPGIRVPPRDENAPIEEVVVRGMRTSLRSSQAIKQFSNVIVDSVTAEDIGALPDRSVTETLQRIPGVAINRFAAGRDPDHFSVEGSGVVVRGLTYVRSEVNGRDSFTANNGRGLSFADIPPELLIGVDVFKSPSADRIEGGIAGTVNLRTRKPFDSAGAMFGFSLQNNYSDFAEKTSPTGSALASYRWDTDAGEFGILGSVVYSEIKSRADRFQVSNFADRTLYSSGDVIDTGGGETPVEQVIFPRGAVMGTQQFDRERYGYSAALQWRSPDDQMEATFQFLRSDSREAWTEHNIEIATDVVTDQGDSRAVPGTSFEFDASNLFDSGYITGPTGWADDQLGADPRTPRFGLQSNNIRRDVKQKFVTDDYALNLVWNVSEDWALSFDFQHVDSSVDNLDAGLWGSSYQNTRINLNGDDIPTVEFTAPILCPDAPGQNCPQYFEGGHDNFTDPYNSFYRAAMDHIEHSDGTSDAFRADAERLIENSDWLQSVRFGYRFAERDQTARFSTYNWGSLSEIWGNGGPVWFDDAVDDVAGGTGGSPLQGYEEFDFDNFFNGETGNPLGGSGRLFYGDNIAENYAGYVDYASAIANEWGGASWVPLAARPGVTDGVFLPGEINPVLEKNNAAYFMVEFGHEFDNGWALSGNVGVRYTDTKREASGFQNFSFQDFSTEAECATPPDPGQEVSPFCGLPVDVREDARAYANGAVTPFTADLDYDYWLPSINLKLEVADGLQFRGAYFKGVSPPDFGLTRAFYNINLATNEQDIEAGGGRPIGRFTAGNPYLLPVESQNFDLTAEWYFSEVGQLSLAVFYKELDNIRTNDIQRQTFTNNGATFDAIVTTAVNSEETGKVKGFEVAYQQTYDSLPGWLSGLGVSANYTYVDSSNVPQSTLSETDPDVAAGNQTVVDISKLPLEGLSKNTFNIAPFYDHENWSARLAYSWRDEFVLTIRDVIVPFQPIVNEATGQLDGSIFYRISDHWKLGVQGVNLLNETIRTSAIVNNDLVSVPRSWFLSDRRYSVILRGYFE